MTSVLALPSYMAGYLHQVHQARELLSSLLCAAGWPHRRLQLRLGPPHRGPAAPPGGAPALARHRYQGGPGGPGGGADDTRAVHCVCVPALRPAAGPDQGAAGPAADTGAQRRGGRAASRGDRGQTAGQAATAQGRAPSRAANDNFRNYVYPDPVRTLCLKGKEETESS